jgi:phenylacetate-CoA ligase
MTTSGLRVQSFQYWKAEIETMSRPELEALQLQKLRAAVEQALKTPFYKERLGKAGIRSGDDIRSLGDLKKLPFTT